jgi:hypothetical protein
VSFHEPNPDIRPTGAEGGEFVDDGPLAADDEPDEDAAVDPTRRPTGAPPVAE